MLGATESTTGPEVARVAIVMMIDVLLQVLTVTGAPFKVTTLPFWVAPNPEPVISTWLPIDPVM